MPRSRIEGLLASFPKLTSTGQQHTIAENEHVRFVYQPLDELFIVLITNRQVTNDYHLYTVAHFFLSSQIFCKISNRFTCLLELLLTFVVRLMKPIYSAMPLNYCVPLMKSYLLDIEKT